MQLERDAAAGVHRVEDAYTNWYLVEDAGRVTVVDSGHPASWRSLLRALPAVGRSLHDVEAVVLTHAHFDHMGFARRAHAELGVPVLVHEREVPLVRHPWGYAHERSRIPYAVRHPRFLQAFASMAAAGALWVQGADDGVRTFPSGATLDVPGSPEVVFTPGHTHGHCALHLPERDALIAGDAIVTYDVYTASAGPQIVAGAATADSARALESLDQLAATGAGVVLTGHGPAWRQGAAGAAELARAAGPS